MKILLISLQIYDLIGRSCLFTFSLVQFYGPDVKLEEIVNWEMVTSRRLCSLSEYIHISFGCDFEGTFE